MFLRYLSRQRCFTLKFNKGIKMQQIKNLCAQWLIDLKQHLKELAKNKTFYFYLALVASLIATLFVKYFVFVACVLCLCFVVFASVEESFCLILFLFPFREVFYFNLHSLSGIVYLGIICILGLRYVIQVVKKQRPLNWIMIAVVAAYFVYALLPIRKTEAGSIGFTFEISYLTKVLIFFATAYFLFIYKKEINFLKPIKTFFWASVLAAIFFVFYDVSPLLQEHVTLCYEGNVYKFNALYQNPNHLAMTMAMLLTVFLYLFYKKKIGLSFYFYATVVFALGYSTIARQFLYCAGAAIVLFVIAIIIRDKLKCYKVLVPFLIAFGVVMLALYSSTVEYIDSLSIKDLTHGFNNSTELSKEELNQIKDPGRGGLIKKYFLDWVSTPLMILFGKGFNYNYLNGFISHCTYIQYLWNMGIVGAILILVIIFVFAKQFTGLKTFEFVKQALKDFGNYLLLLPLAALCLVQSLTFETISYVIMFLVLLALMKGNCKENIEDDDKQLVQNQPEKIENTLEDEKKI